MNMTVNEILPYAAILLGSSLITAAFSYIAWAMVRSTFVRQEAFRLRDSLWDTARSLEQLDDPGYQEIRRRLNSFILTAPGLSVLSLEMCFRKFAETSESHEKSEPASMVCRSPEMQAAVDATDEKMTSLLVQYVLFYRASGWLSLLWCNVSQVRKLASAWVAAITDLESDPFGSNLRPRMSA